MRYAQFYAALFGFESAVYSFGRWSTFLEAMCRRLGAVLWSMYVDDGQLTDLAEARHFGQLVVHNIFEASGARLAEEKRTWMADSGDFLGIIHNFAKIKERGGTDFRGYLKRVGLPTEMGHLEMPLRWFLDFILGEARNKKKLIGDEFRNI